MDAASEGHAMCNEPSLHDRVSLNSVRFIRPREAPRGELRNFEADIEATAESGGESLVIGGISGRLSWLAWLPELSATRRTVGSFAEMIAAALAIGDLLAVGAESEIDTALIIDNLWLEPSWQGNRLCRRIIEELIDLLLLTPESTLVLTYLVEPSKPTLSLGARHDTQHTLRNACARAGFEQWRQSNTWWMHPDSPSWQPYLSIAGSSAGIDGLTSADDTAAGY
jgi:hypothetical protein